MVSTEPAIQQQPQQVESRANSQPPKPNTTRTHSGGDSRATSPAASPSLGGHSVVAKRATSPKAPKLKSGSPLGSRATSPVTNSRAASPTGIVSGHSASRAGSPSAQKGSNKRKAVDDAVNGSPVLNVNGSSTVPKPKKRKAQAPGVAPIIVPTEQLRVMLIDWLGNTSSASTRDCIHHFTPYLTDGEKKTEFSGLVREVAQLKGGVLVLRKKFQEGGSGAPSPVRVEGGA